MLTQLHQSWLDRFDGKLRHRQRSVASRHQRGVSILELLVGITIGLLVVAVAGGALMISRGVTGSVSDASGIQQQASHALRVLGSQLRQSGSLRMNMNPASAPASRLLETPVGFEKKADATDASATSFDAYRKIELLSGTDTSLTVGFRRYTESVFSSATPISMSRNCVDAPKDNSPHQRVESIFSLNTQNELVCGGNNAPSQPIVQNVANFKVRYLMQDIASAPGDPKIQYVDAATVGAAWGKVQAVEVCLVLYGNEVVDMPAGSSYTDCDGSSVNMTTLSGSRAKRMHLVFRNVFQLRSQGLA